MTIVKIIKYCAIAILGATIIGTVGALELDTISLSRYIITCGICFAALFALLRGEDDE